MPPDYVLPPSDVLLAQGESNASQPASASGRDSPPSPVDGAYLTRIAVRSLARIVIVEVKQPRVVNHVGAMAALRRVSALEHTVSKYCLGTALVAPVRANCFKPALRAVERLSA